jgi:hypothetical protein
VGVTFPAVTQQHSGWFVVVVGLLATTAACGDPYERYAAEVRDDVDAAMVAGFRMTARLQLTVVHNQIPNDSLAVVATTVARAARTVRARATDFDRVTPPSGLIASHAQLRAQMWELTRGLDALATTFRTCAATDPVAGSTAERACQAHVTAVSSRYAYVGEDLALSRNSVARLLLPHGVILGPMTSDLGADR